MTENKNRYRVFQSDIKPSDKIKLTYYDGELNLHGYRSDDSLIFNIRFEYVLLTRVCPESIRLKLLNDTQSCVGTILVDEESDVINWISEQDLQITDMSNFKHYIFFLANEVADVIAQGVPIFDYV